MTLADGRRLIIPDAVQFERGNLKPGSNVKLMYEEWSGENIVTSVTILPDSTSLGEPDLARLPERRRRLRLRRLRPSGMSRALDIQMALRADAIVSHR